MNYVLYAVPFFFLLIGLELLADRWRGQRNYRLADALNSLSAGVLSQALNILTKAVGLLTYIGLYEYTAWFDLSAQQPWVWLLAFVIYDFCYYWNHRLGHERNVLWAAHAVHHQSEEYNLSTALRQTSTGFLFSWIFYVPMALIGVPPVVFVAVAAMNLLYQFWVHTRHVPKLGWLEWLLITPSNHRVHHAQNPRYMDRNYGGVFIVWDRLFGTFQEELDGEPVVFGVTVPLASWNPLWANVQVYAAIWRDARLAQSWWDKLRIWFMPTGWRPADVAARYPQAKVDLSQFRKFDIALPRTVQVYAVLQFTLYLLGGVWALAVGDALLPYGALLVCVWMAVGLYSVGTWLELRPWALKVDVLRLLLNVPLLALAITLAMLPAAPALYAALVIYSALNLIVLLRLRGSAGLAAAPQPGAQAH